MRSVKKIVSVSLVVFTLQACSYIPWFGESDEVVLSEPRLPTKLEAVESRVQLQQKWSVSGKSNADNKYIQLQPFLIDNKIIFADGEANVSMYDNTKGSLIWTRDLPGSITGGVGGNAETLVVGSADGRLYGLRTSDGEDIWSILLTSEIRSVSQEVDDIIVVRTSDSRVHGIDITNGDTTWILQQSSPALTLRGVGIPLIRDNIAYIGMDNGKVLAISISGGNVIWETRVDVPSGRTELERIVDVDGQLSADNSFVYAASYHGRVVAIDQVNGRTAWARDIPSAAGVTSDENYVYLVDRDDSIWALEKSSGITVWKQDALLYRELSSPLLIQGALVVGDDEGYAHALSKEDGKIIGRIEVSEHPVQTVQLNNSEYSYFVGAGGKLSSFILTPAN